MKGTLAAVFVAAGLFGVAASELAIAGGEKADDCSQQSLEACGWTIETQPVDAGFSAAATVPLPPGGGSATCGGCAGVGGADATLVNGRPSGGGVAWNQAGETIDQQYATLQLKNGSSCNSGTILRSMNTGLQYNRQNSSTLLASNVSGNYRYFTADTGHSWRDDGANFFLGTPDVCRAAY